MKRKRLNFMDIKEEDTLGREEMKFIMAGCGGSGCTVTCEPCFNDSCRDVPVPDCSPLSVYTICGPGSAGGSGPRATCGCY